MAVHRNCEGMTRRDSLKLGLGGLLGAGLTDMLRLTSASAAGAADTIRPTAKSCILVWLDGGPSHFETFDPKPDAPREIRGELDPIKTQVPGMLFCETMPRLAAQAKMFTTIRSIRHDQGNHGAGNHYMTTGAPTRIPVGCGAFVSFHPSIGSVVAHERRTQNSLPAYFTMPSMNRSGGPNFLGANYAPFVVGGNPNSKDFRVRDVALPGGLETGRFSSRNDLRKQVDRLKRVQDKVAADPALALDSYYHQGLDLVTSKEAQKAFDLSSEKESLRDEYGRNDVGQRMLLARRLVQAGVPFITINDGGWDHHSEVFKGLKKKCDLVDRGVAALIRDLADHGLLKETLVVMLGEFGRTPKVTTLPGSSTPGRDHWSNAMSVFMAGGGTPGGLCLGATDKNGYSAVDRVLSPENFASTIYRKLGINPDKMLYTPQGRPTHIVSDPTPIAEVMG